MLSPTPILDDLAGGTHDLGGHYENEQQGVGVEDDRGIERAEKAGHRHRCREPGVSDPDGSELDQFVALSRGAFACFGREDGYGNGEQQSVGSPVQQSSPEGRRLGSDRAVDPETTTTRSSSHKWPPSIGPISRRFFRGNDMKSLPACLFYKT